ncbi:MAG: hypothetical protein ABIP94_17120, partial [Planctomycetota bacterium]
MAGGFGLTGGDQTTPVGVIAHDGTGWRGLGFPANGTIRALAVFNGELVVAGLFSAATAGGQANNIARRSASSWQSLGIGTNDTVLALTVFNGELVAGGSFTGAGGQQANHGAKWSGSTWSPLSNSVAYISSLAVLNGGLYASVGLSVTRWNGTSWSNVASAFPSVTRLGARNGTSHTNTFLFAVGAFTAIGGITAQHVASSGIGGTTWSAMGTGLQFSPSDLLVSSTEVIATGGTTGNSQRVWRWNGTAWSSLGNLGPSTGTATATAPVSYGGYVAGLLNVSPAQPRNPSVFRFASDWTPLFGKGIPTPILCLTFDAADTIAGGAFGSIDGVTVNGIARRSGTTWSALGTGLTGGGATVRAVARASNGDLFAAGDFTTAGGNAASNIARWNGSSWAPLGTGTNGTVRALVVEANGNL